MVGVDVSDAWNRFKDRLHAFALRRLGSSAEADDLVQDVLVRLLEHQNGIEPDRLAAWLFTAARNALIDRSRRSGRNAFTVGEADLHSVAEAPEEDMPELTACMQPLLAMLSTEDRLVLEEVELAGRSQTELARELDVPRSTVKSRVQRARRRLRERVEHCCTIERDGRGMPHDYAPRGNPAYTGCEGCA